LSAFFCAAAAAAAASAFFYASMASAYAFLRDSVLASEAAFSFSAYIALVF